MGTITANCHAIPLTVHNIADYLLHGLQEEVAYQLPIAIKSIQDMCKMNMKAVVDLDRGLLETIYLISELSEWCVSSQGKCDTKVHGLKLQLKVLIDNIKNMENQEKSMQKEIKREKETIQKLEYDFKEELKKMPNGFEIIGMKLTSFDFKSVSPFKARKKQLKKAKSQINRKTSPKMSYESIYKILKQFSYLYICLEETDKDRNHKVKNVKKKLCEKCKEFGKKPKPMSSEDKLVERICRYGAELCGNLSKKETMMSLVDAAKEVTSLQKELVCVIEATVRTFRHFRGIYQEVAKLCEMNGDSDNAINVQEIKSHITSFLHFYKVAESLNISAASVQLVDICESVINSCDDTENNGNDVDIKSRFDGLKKEATQMQSTGM